MGLGRILRAEPGSGSSRADLGVRAIMDSGAPAVDFFEAFNRTRYLVHEGSTDRVSFMGLLEQGLSYGVAPGQMETYMKERLAERRA